MHDEAARLAALGDSLDNFEDPTVPQARVELATFRFGNAMSHGINDVVTKFTNVLLEVIAKVIRR